MRMQSISRAVWSRATAVLVATTLSSGCGYLMQARDNARPTAVPAMHAAQTLNPEAGKNRKVVAGLDATTGKKVGDGYAKSFEPSQGDSLSFQGTGALGGQ